MRAKNLFIIIVAAVVLAGCSAKRKAVKTEPRPITPARVVPSTSRQVADLVAEARKWIGTPYRYGGHSRSGTDCSGMIMELFLKIYDIKLPRSSAMQHEYSRPLDFDDMQPGDLVFFATGSNKSRVSHVGLYIGDGRMIHASSSRGVMESALNEKYWIRTRHSSGRIVETDARHGKQKKADVIPPARLEIDAKRLQELYDALDQTIDSLYVTDPDLFD